MRLDRYDRVSDFLAAAGDHLAAREAEHNLILGISASVERSPALYPEPPYFAVVTDADRVVAAALRTPPFNLVLSEVDDPAALALLSDDLAGTPLPGVTGPPGAAAAFAERWVAAGGGSWRVAMEEQVYQLTRVVAPRPAPGSARLAVPADRGLIEEWLSAFGREALMDRDAERARLGIEDWLSPGGRRFWLWEDAGRPVSLVSAGSRTPNGIRIGPVYTPPSHRGRGYASNLTAEVSRRMLAEGRRFCFLYTDAANGTANRIYRAIGYERVTDALMVRFAP